MNTAQLVGVYDFDEELNGNVRDPFPDRFQSTYGIAAWWFPYHDDVHPPAPTGKLHQDEQRPVASPVGP